MRVTRAEVIKTASDMADRNGLHNVSLKAIAENLGIRTPSLYNHIGSLDELLREIAHSGMRTMNEKILGAAAILSLATACSSKNVNEPTANESSQSASSESSSNGMDESSPMDDLKEDAKDAVLPSEGTADAKQSTLTGTISDIKDFMFTITADGTDYEFSFEQDQKPDGLSDVKDGDKVTVTYTGTVSEVDAFSGTVLSVKKAE